MINVCKNIPEEKKKYEDKSGPIIYSLLLYLQVFMFI
jgi:hypothetical protein